MINNFFGGDFKIYDQETVSLSDQIKSILMGYDLNIVNFETPVHSKYIIFKGWEMILSISLIISDVKVTDGLLLEP